ncbi:two-component system response regulator NreC [Wenyingzhuangia heitensis]|uniref:Two-component system response regulator NreC n=1 Tax=Wenyingzhuangia heitensis TaxID=1487859 RepID=A0ABX0U5Q3_9FLAO|nr:response regulator transcription factor [Wenyingzhuangia heitensis]NIJ44175.1 two-component system response regulator NreC [Wenyingzhuangia heitensis]
MIKVLVADDHPLMAQGIKNSLHTATNLQVVGVVANGKEAIDFIEQNNVDVLLLDIEMPKMNGIDCAKYILKNKLPAQIIMLSMYQEKSIIKMLFELGVHGYLLKTSTSSVLIDVITEVSCGERIFDQNLSNQKTPESEVLYKANQNKLILQDLSKRELEVLKELSKGLTNKEVGEVLFISPRTVDTHRTNLMKKLKVHNVAGLIRFTYEMDLH